MKHTYTKEDVQNAVLSSLSVRQALTKIGVLPVGGNYKVFYRFVAKHEISIDHFTGSGWAKNQRFKPKDDITVYITNEKPISSFRLKARLLAEGLIEPKCVGCDGDQWLGEPMPLELDHVDGNSDNNTLSNLRLLCPNCHSLTPTYRGKNRKLRVNSPRP